MEQLRQSSKPTPTITPVASGLLQRKCACGQHTVAGGECEACKKKREATLQRRAISSPPVGDVPPIVHDVLRSPGQPLDAATRAFMEPRFGHDFSQVQTQSDASNSVQADLWGGPANDPLKRETDRVAAHIAMSSMASVPSKSALSSRYDFGRVRLHTGAQAAESARAINALAYTVGQNIVFGAGQYAPGTSEGRQLMAHELTHVIQQAAWSGQSIRGISDPADAAERAADHAAQLAMQDATPGVVQAVAGKAAPVAMVWRDLAESTRYQTVHEQLFVLAPGGGTRRPWRNPSGTDEGTPGEIKTTFQQYLEAQRAQHRLDETYIPERTTEMQVDTAAIQADARIRARFPSITTAIPKAQIRARVSTFGAQEAGRDVFVRQWIENRLVSVTDLEEYNISDRDARYKQLITDILNDPFMGHYSRLLAARVAAFHEEDATTGERHISVNIGMPEELRAPTLIHELTHFYAHPTFLQWLQGTTNADFYGEGFTEYLARLVLTAEERTSRASYQDRWDAINTQVAPYVPINDIERAYFVGEVWRIETRSMVARRDAGTQIGLREAATAREEAESSRLGPGISQTVVPGQHYRFMNLGFDWPTPKPEHVAFFREIKSEHLDPVPTLGVRFIGYASTAGPFDHNDRLSLRRAQAFYLMAQGEGLSSTRLIDATNPPHLGETRVTATEEDPATRAFNRRVEMFLQPIAGGGTGTPNPQGRRGSRIDVATSVQAYRTTYPDSRRGGLLTQALLARLRNQRTTASVATAAVGAGERTFGSAPGSSEERAGVSVGRSATAAPETTAQRRAVVIGNSVYNPGTTMGRTVEPTRPLPESLADASRIAAVLSRRRYAVSHLVNQTALGIDSALTAALTGLSAGSELFFFYSGHGTPEGLIGVDGTAFTPAQMLSIRTAARTAQVNLIINTDACHAGIFADAIRGAELRDMHRAAIAAGGSINSTLVALLDAAIDVQDAKGAYNAAIQVWWAHRYELEAVMAAPPPITDMTRDPRMVAWNTHYETGALHWNNFVARANPLLDGMRIAAVPARITLRRLTLTPAASPFDNTGEMLVQAGLDDVDTLTNQVLTTVDRRLP